MGKKPAASNSPATAAASAQVLGFVARRLAAEPVGLVFVARVRSEELAGSPELVVEGLREGGAAALLARTPRTSRRIRSATYPPITENTWRRLAKLPTTLTDNRCRHGHGARAGPRRSWGGANQYRSIEQVAARKVHRIVLSGPCNTSRSGEYRSRSLPTKPPDRSASTVTGVGLGDGGGVSSRCQVPSGLEALSALMNVHSIHRPRGDGAGAGDEPGGGRPSGGGHLGRQPPLIIVRHCAAPTELVILRRPARQKAHHRTRARFGREYVPVAGMFRRSARSVTAAGLSRSTNSGLNGLAIM